MVWQSFRNPLCFIIHACDWLGKKALFLIHSSDYQPQVEKADQIDRLRVLWAELGLF